MDTSTGDAAPRPVWHEYEMLADVQKFCVETVIRSTVAYFAVSGGVLAFVLAGWDDERQAIKLGLALPLLGGLLLMKHLAHLRAAAQQTEQRAEELRADLDVGSLPHNGLASSMVAGLLLLVGLTIAAFVVLFGFALQNMSASGGVF